MSKIDELLKNEKVEWKKLGDLFNIRTGYTPSKSKKDYWKNGTVNWFTIEDIRQKGNILYCANKKINKNAVKKSTFKSNSIVLSTIATVGEHALILNDFVINQQFIVFTLKENFENKINMQYINYYFYRVGEYCRRHKRIGNIPTVDSELILKLDIPIPSIETQEKIVKTLDKFTNYVTELQAELQTELQARNKQYEYYRDMLLSEKYLTKLTNEFYQLEDLKSFDFVKISELCLRQRGIKITAEQMKSLDKENSSVKVFAGGNTTANLLPEEVGIENIINKPSVIVKSRGNIDFEYYDRDFTHKNEMWSYSSLDEEKLNIKFLYYILKNNLKYFIDNSISGKLPQISTGLTDNHKVPLPSIHVQNKVVEVLDKFQDLLSDTQGLLPEEIEQRQKQYEYYREKLLTFEHKSDSTPHAAK